MSAFLQHLLVTLRLYFRNRMAMVYGYLFPAIFLVAFWVLYRYERVPLVRHMGELLTIAVLGGACFGLPTTMVSERERGVWRRYRVTPIPAGSLVASTVAARFFLLLTAGVLQLALAMAIGMPAPQHPLDLFVAFGLVAFAFLGIGLVIAMLADNVPAVQALGQCIFLPMLIIGGVAVPLTVLPDWAQHVSAFFPGRYAVESIQACVSGAGLHAIGFSLVALTIIGIAGMIAASGMFRWDVQQRFATLHGRRWIAVALGAWVAVGVLAESRGHIDARSRARTVSVQEGDTAPRIISPGPAAARIAGPALSEAEAAAAHGATPETVAPRAPRGGANATPSGGSTGNSPAPSSAAAAWPPISPASPTSWETVTLDDIDRDLIFTHLPPDSGIISPVAPPDQQPDADVQAQLDELRLALPGWAPGKVADPVQRARNYLYVAAVPDLFQRPLERFAPRVIFARLQQEIPKDDLVKILYWIAMHPDDGDDSALDDLQPLGINDVPEDAAQIRERVALYGVKLLARLLGRIPSP